MPASHAGRERKRQFQILHIAGVYLIKGAVPCAGVVLSWSNPLPIIGFELALILTRLVVLLDCRLQHRTDLSRSVLQADQANLQNRQNKDS